MDGRLTLAALAIAFLAWFGVQVRAWPTWEGLNHTSAVVAACADAVLHGEAPGHARGDTFLVTAYFPPVPLLVAAARSTGMSWRAALRWVNLFSILALLAAVALCGQALGGGAVSLSVSLAILLVSFPFLRASLGGRADPLAAALAIGALAAWCHDPRRRGWLAPALAAAACLVKATSFAVPLAVMLSAIGPGARRGAGPFAARFFAALAAGVVITMPWHGPGWYADVLYTLAFTPPNSAILFRGPLELLRYLASFAELTVAAGLAIVYLTSEWSRGRPVGPFAVAALALAMLVMTNRGSDHNHLLELVALAAVASGLWAEHANRREASLGLALVLLAVCGAAWRESREVGRASARPEARRGVVLAAVRAEPGAVLCEDPLLALAAGRRAEVSDPAALRARVGKGDARARAIVERIEAGRYGLVVLDQDLASERGHWYRDFHLGAAVSEAIDRRYSKSGTADGYHLYRLKPEEPLLQ